LASGASNGASTGPSASASAGATADGGQRSGGVTDPSSQTVIAGDAAATAAGSAATKSAETAAAASVATGRGAASGAPLRASAEGTRTGSAALGAGKYANADGAGAGGANGTAVPGAAQGTQVLGQAQINLALAEGSDATGATASALQAANAASTAAPAAVQAPLMVGVATAVAGDGTAASATAPVSAAAMSTSDSAGLAGDAGSHAHGDANDPGVGLGGNGAAALQQLAPGPASASGDSTPAATLRVSAPVDSPEFPQGVADRVSFAVDNNWTSTKLQVNPPQLGPIDLQIAVQGDHAQVMMSTHSAVTREALESSLPRLKEMLNSQGFTQVSVDISQRSFQDRSAFSQPYTWAKSGPGTSSAAAVAPVTAPSAAAPRSVGALDAYA
jgi:flagellar hook-length control protein FliK